MRRLALVAVGCVLAAGAYVVARAAEFVDDARMEF
jgi:hypothetical protein